MKVKEFATVVSGATPSSEHPEYYDGNIVWFTPKDLSDQKTKYVSEGERKITKEGYASCSAKMLPAGSVLMSSRAPIGLLAIAKTECCTNQGFKSFIVNESLCNPEFLYYYLKHHIREVEALGSGTTFKEVSKEDIENFDVNLPSLAMQNAIVHVLAELDSKIENNNAICAELEAMAKLLYDYWFVQFDFPDENGRPYKSSGGKMVWNEELKREIPKGWEIRTISDLGIYVSDYTANGSFAGLAENVKYNEGIPYAILVRSVDFSNGFSPSKYIWINEHGYEYLKTCHLTGGEIIIINVGAVGDTYRVPCLNVNMVLGPNGLVIKSKNLDNYLYCFLRSDYGKTTIDNMASGSVQRKFNKTDFRNMKILVPPKQLLNQFEMMYTPISDYVSNLWLENRDLASLRDFLLPLLMNGQVGFKEVDCH